MDESDRDRTDLWYVLSLAFQLGFLIAVPIVLFIGFGQYLDEWAGTSPLFVLIGALLGTGVTAYEVYQYFIPLREHGDHD